MWAYFWFAFFMLLTGAGILATGVFYGMFMLSVALSDDDEDDSDNDWVRKLI